MYAIEKILGRWLKRVRVRIEGQGCGYKVRHCSGKRHKKLERGCRGTGTLCRNGIIWRSESWVGEGTMSCPGDKVEGRHVCCGEKP